MPFKEIVFFKKVIYINANINKYGYYNNSYSF